ncbi:MAG TPA: carbohydrate kinase family protein [Patescibacteria group bacterium]|nr:carbohydrate kinase family protein [Patescibacteria group bacterium]
MAILISGSLTYDYILNFPDSFRNHLKLEGEHVLDLNFNVEKVTKSRGGTAGNIAYTLKLLGADPVLVSALGNDGNEYLKFLGSQGIETKNVLVDKEGGTATAYILTDADNNELTALHVGPLTLTREFSLHNLESKPNLVVVSSTDKETMIRHLKESAELGVKAVFDPSQQLENFTEIELKKMISQAYFVIGNDYEIKRLEEKVGWDTEEMLKNTKVVVITRGAKGSFILTAEGEEIAAEACPPLSYDDPAGAGDAYRAGFFVGFELGYPWKTCAQMGSLAACYAIEAIGTQTHLFTEEEFRGRYKKEYNETITLER